MAKLELKHLNKTYGPKIVPVKDLSLTVADGEFLTLLGPSGCGKSTTLRLIAGLEQPTRGQILIGDQVVNHRGPGDRNIAMVFQSYALYPHMSVYDNIASGLKLRKMPAAEIQARVDAASRVLGLEGLLDRRPSKLSGGQRQRVALGRALVRNPDVFLLDEPLSNLDALLREQVRAELKQLFATQNTPVVYVTHDQTEAMTLSTKVAVLYNGNLQQLDPPQRIYTHPANQFVAGFIGSPQMNLLTLPCQGNCAILGSFKLQLPEQFAPPPEIMLGIRPEHVALVTPKTPDAVQGQIYLVENLGMSNLLSLRIQNSDLTIRVLLPSDQTWESESVYLSLPSNLIHWFHVQTGERLPG
ncbi:MAG: ABC transporter ATP-binding protein [Cyanothece sp. SIO1E1]|nr:ABC transporter ATP-binding protein [Cyanothece sp. SIO1E1]